MSLTDARLQVHWAAQAAASVGRTLLPPKPDDSHQAFTWSEEQHALMQVQSGIRIRDLTLLVDGDAFALRGSTLNEAFAFCEARLHVTLLRLGEGLPPHPVATDPRHPGANPH